MSLYNKINVPRHHIATSILLIDYSFVFVNYISNKKVIGSVFIDSLEYENDKGLVFKSLYKYKSMKIMLNKIKLDEFIKHPYYIKIDIDLNKTKRISSQNIIYKILN